MKYSIQEDRNPAKTLYHIKHKGHTVLTHQTRERAERALGELVELDVFYDLTKESPSLKNCTEYFAFHPDHGTITLDGIFNASELKALVDALTACGHGPG